MQLLFIGLLLVYLFAKNPNIAYKVSGLIAICSCIYTSYNVYMNQVTGYLFTQSINKQIEYVYWVHSAATTYIPSYILGIIVGYLMAEGKAIPQLKTWRDHVPWLLALYFTIGTIGFINVANNVLQVIPSSLSFAIIMINRATNALIFVICLLYFTALKPLSEQIFGKLEPSEEGKVRFHFLKGLSRLSFSVYIFNYWIISTIIFTSRSLLPVNPLSLVSKYNKQFN